MLSHIFLLLSLKVYLGNNQRGVVRVAMENGQELKLDQARLVPRIKKSLLSVGQLDLRTIPQSSQVEYGRLYAIQDILSSVAREVHSFASQIEIFLVDSL